MSTALNGRGICPVPERSRLTIGLLVFLAAFGLRLHFAIAHPHFDNIFAVRGVPFSDGQQWTSGAIRLTEGEGLGTVSRPGLSVALALLYTWFGYSFDTITALNVVVGSVTASCVFLVARMAFNGPIATAAAAFFVLDPSQIIQTPQASTEPMGLMFFVASVYCLMLADEHAKLKPALLAGGLIALSNLTRPLTLFCAPFYAGHLVLAEWARRREVKKALLLGIAFCAGLVLTMSPWLIRQKLVHGTWAVSTNLGEALYGATSPQYGTWTSTVRKDADRDGVAPAAGARYEYFVRKSLENIRRYPAFYTGQVVRSYWKFLNGFNLEVRLTDRAFQYRQWTKLVEAQILFAWITATLLFAAGLRAWIRSGTLTGCVFLLVSTTFFVAWRVAPSFSGVIILIIGLATALIAHGCRSIGLLGWSLALTGVGDALFNNAILYRAVLMTDWIFSLFYLSAFYYGANLTTRAVLRALGKERAPLYHAAVSASGGESLTSTLEHWARLILKGAAVMLTVFVLASSARLLIVNSSSVPRSVPPQLSDKAQRAVIARLRDTSAIMHEALPGPEKASLALVESAESSSAQRPPERSATASASTVSQHQRLVVVGSETLSRYVFYFPKGTEFEQRDRLFTKRPFDCSIFRTKHGMAVFPASIPNRLRGREVVLVGRIDDFHPGGSRLGKIVQCMAIIPILDQEGKLDYRNAVTLPVQVPRVF